MILVELFTKPPFKMPIININNSESITISAINNTEILNYLRCIEALYIT